MIHATSKTSSVVLPSGNLTVTPSSVSEIRSDIGVDGFSDPFDEI